MKIYEVLNDKKSFSFPCIYLWTNLINGKVYVGQSQNFYNRMQKYYEGRENRPINFALNKYGFDNFDISALEENTDIERLDELEQYWMDYYNSYDDNVGYNICKEAGTTRGYHHTEADKAKMSEIVKKRLQEHPEYVKYGEDHPMYGTKASKETRRKMSESRKGNQNAKGKTWKLSPECCERRRRTMLGRKNMLGKKHSAETRAKIAESNRNRVISDETKRKISESNKGKSAKKVRCVELNVVFDSVTLATEFVGLHGSGISGCLHGKQKTAGGYHWEYVKE